jgi:hypothetical protein
MSAQLAGELTFFGAAGDGDGAKAHLHRELHPEVAQAADPKDGDQITGPGTGAAQRVEHGQPRARDRRGVNGRQFVGNTGQRARGSHHVFGVSAGKCCAGDHADLAVNELTAPTAATMPAMAARPADRHPFTLAPTLHTLADRVDVPGDLMPRRDRKLQTRPLVVDKNRIGVADAAGLHRDPHSAGSRIGQSAIDDC